MTQKDWVIEQLSSKGYVTRNEALANYISRLGAIIHTMKKEGWEFMAVFEDGDYVYRNIITH